MHEDDGIKKMILDKKHLDMQLYLDKKHLVD